MLDISRYRTYFSEMLGISTKMPPKPQICFQTTQRFHPNTDTQKVSHLDARCWKMKHFCVFSSQPERWKLKDFLLMFIPTNKAVSEVSKDAFLLLFFSPFHRASAEKPTCKIRPDIGDGCDGGGVFCDVVHGSWFRMPHYKMGSGSNQF